MYQKASTIFGALLLSIFFFFYSASAQTTVASPTPSPEPASALEKERADLRLLQSNEFLVDTAYLEDDSEFRHKFSFERVRHGAWAANFTEEITFVTNKHQLRISIPAYFGGVSAERPRGFRDAHIEYSNSLYGNNSSRVTFSPGVGVSLPIGSFRKGLGSGGVGFSFRAPVGVMLSDRFASNSLFEVTYTRSARNSDGQRANTVDYEVGQSFVWFAKPKLNFFVETVWERSQEVTGQNLTENEYEFLVSPAVRWRHSFKGMTISPGIAVPFGIGPSRGENKITFFIAFGHPLRREEY